MKPLNIIDAIGQGYSVSWEGRAYFARLAAVPVVLKLLTLYLILALGWEQNLLRQALVMLPSYFADGWMASHIARLVFFGQRWPFRPTGDTERDLAALEERAYGLMRGVLVFVLIEFLITGLMAGISAANLFTPENADPEAHPAAYFAAVVLFILMLWGFRFLWIYIPAAVNYPLDVFLKKIRGFRISIDLLAIWLVCFLPFLMIFSLFFSMMIAPPGKESLPASLDFLFNLGKVILDTVIRTVATVGISAGLKQILLPSSPSATGA
jgi:hypothetical protein